MRKECLDIGQSTGDIGRRKGGVHTGQYTSDTGSNIRARKGPQKDRIKGTSEGIPEGGGGRKRYSIGVNAVQEEVGEDKPCKYMSRLFDGG